MKKNSPRMNSRAVRDNSNNLLSRSGSRKSLNISNDKSNEENLGDESENSGSAMLMKVQKYKTNENKNFLKSSDNSEIKSSPKVGSILSYSPQIQEVDEESPQHFSPTERDLIMAQKIEREPYKEVPLFTLNAIGDERNKVEEQLQNIFLLKKETVNFGQKSSRRELPKGLTTPGNRSPESNEESPHIMALKSRIIQIDTSKVKNESEKIYGLISTFYLTKKFIAKLRNHAAHRQTKWLHHRHYQMINDYGFFHLASSEFDSNPIVNNFKRMASGVKRATMGLYEKAKGSRFKKQIERVEDFLAGVLSPGDPTKLMKNLWDLLYIIILLFYFLKIPLDIGFEMDLFKYLYDYNEPIMHSIETGSLCFFIFDILLGFNTGHYEQGRLIVDRTKIARHFIKKGFILECISLIPLVMDNFMDSYDYPWIKWLCLIFYFRIIKFTRILQNIEVFFLADEKLHNTISLFKLVFRIVLLSHLFSCIWHYVGMRGFDGNSWIHHYNLDQEGWVKRYLYSFYYVCVTMNTVGFGDLVSQNQTEMVYNIFFIYLACGIFAYNINSVGIIVQDINRRKNEYKRKMNLINSYMKKKSITLELKMRIRKYLEYTWEEEKKQEVEEELAIVNKLSNSLKEELLLEANGPILRKIPFFSKNFSEEVLRKTVNIIQEVRYTPEDIIFLKDDTEDPSLFIVKNGHLELFVITPRQKEPVTVLRSLKENDVFGEVSFFTGMPRLACAKSINFSSVFCIKQKDFIRILIDHPEDFQKFCMIKDKINIYNRTDDIDLRCYSCNMEGHTINECPLLHHTPMKEVIISRYNYSQPQRRKPQKRRNTTVSALLSKNFIKDQLTRFRVNELGTSFEDSEARKIEVEYDKESNEDTDNLPTSTIPSKTHISTFSRQLSEFTKKTRFTEYDSPSDPNPNSQSKINDEGEISPIPKTNKGLLLMKRSLTEMDHRTSDEMNERRRILRGSSDSRKNSLVTLKSHRTANTKKSIRSSMSKTNRSILSPPVYSPQNRQDKERPQDIMFFNDIQIPFEPNSNNLIKKNFLIMQDEDEKESLLPKPTKLSFINLKFPSYSSMPKLGSGHFLPRPEPLDMKKSRFASISPIEPDPSSEKAWGSKSLRIFTTGSGTDKVDTSVGVAYKKQISSVSSNIKTLKENVPISIINFDVGAIFEFYFPHNNVDAVVHKANEILEKNNKDFKRINNSMWQEKAKNQFNMTSPLKKKRPVNYLNKKNFFGAPGEEHGLTDPISAQLKHFKSKFKNSKKKSKLSVSSKERKRSTLKDMFISLFSRKTFGQSKTFGQNKV